MGVRWSKRPTDLDLAPHASRVKAGVREVMRESALAMEAEAKVNAPWQDDTGLARAGLVGSVSGNASVSRVTLSHSMEYGQYLELRWPKDAPPPPELEGFVLEFLEAGKYAIIWPTIEGELPRLRAALERLLQ